MEKINVDFISFVVWVKRMSDEVFEPSPVQSRQFQTLTPLIIMNMSCSAYEPNLLKSIVKFSFQKDIFGEVHLWVGIPQLCKKLYFKYLLISKKLAL